MTLLPRIYCASPWSRHKMWQVLHDQLFEGRIEVVSTWHKPEGQALNDKDPADCLKGWTQNIADIKRAHFVLAYAEAKDHPNGTIFEIGYANALNIPVFLTGNFAWGTWRFTPPIVHLPTLREAVDSIVHYRELTR